MRRNRNIFLFFSFFFFLHVAPECQSYDRSDWSLVEDIDSSRKIRIVLYNDEAPKGFRKFNGHFYSATKDSITIVIKKGIITQKFQKNKVRKILVKVPPRQDYESLLITGLAAIPTIYFTRIFRELVLPRAPFVIAPIVATWGISRLVLSYKPIYDVPRKQRSP